ncbi:hypothetical protein BDW42DRAFT_187471 [Aspergillus taichungensis]|uniref:Nucleoside phosphorylase domain-containing protein n=1 Tax=Aspergillus taichungensis TaxID=482145 RepID=A0A2J5HMB4_9EURO|nr:hypothetical protein BDW42DRAFT_187471 [Aspergillus taichungensis]
MTEIRQKILQSLPTTQRFSRREPTASYKMTYSVDWDPMSFLKDQGFEGEPFEAVATAITLTGSDNTAQALTSSQYLQQTWPSSALLVLENIRKALGRQRENHATGELSDGTRLTIWIEAAEPTGKSTLLVEVIGTPYSVAEIGEQIAWLGASLRSSPYPEGLAYSQPMIDNIRVIDNKGKAPAKAYLAELQGDINFHAYSKQSPSKANGLCWHGLFRNPIVVEGFPILRRPDKRTASGLEIPLYIMASLAQARYVNIFMGGIYIKGFSTILVPTEQCDDMTMWHLVHNKNGDRISYLDNPVTPTEQVTVPQLEKSRHVLGWCSEAKYLAGTSDIGYQITSSRLPKPRDNCILDQTSVSSRQMIIGRVPFVVGYKDTPFHISRGGYIRKLKWIFKKSVVFWDEGEKRGWLVNGTSALLHLVRASLVHDSNDGFSSEFLFRWEDLQKAPAPFSNKPHAAISVLLNHTNRSLKIYPEKDDFIRFEDRVEHFLNILEQIIDHQVFSAGPEGSLYKSKRIPRAHLEGWDFHDLTNDIDPIYPRVATLPTMGKGWVDFVRSIPAITLLGTGYYLAAGIADLEEIMDSSGDKTMHPVRLTENLTWHNLETAFAACRCANGQGKHLDVVQVILPPAVLDESEGPKDPIDLEESGAVVFGYNEHIQWCWDDHGDPEKGSLECFDNRSSLMKSDSRNSLKVLPSKTATDSGQVSRATSPSMEDLLEGLVAEDYTVGIVCASPLELLAVRALFDMTHPDIHVAAVDSNHYALGSMGRHKVVAACLPDGEYGTNSAADVASNLRRSFPGVKFCLLVGIGGGVPSQRNDIRLGDLVVSKPIGMSPGVMQYDMGKALKNGIFEQQGFLQAPPRLVLTALSNLKSDPHLSRTPLQGYIEEIAACRREYRYPGAEHDRLFVGDFAHDRRYDTCDRCNPSHQCRRPGRPDTHPRIHYGLIASGNRVVKDARLRDQWSRQKNVLCFEMEAAGIVNTLPCLVVRGICDYSDSHKNKRFQEYAAATAASYAKLLLSYMKETNDLEGALRPAKMDETAFLNVFRRGFSFLAWGKA